MNEAVQERSRRHDDRRRLQLGPVRKRNPGDARALNLQRRDLADDKVDAAGLGQFALCGLTIQPSVGLRPRSLYSGTLPAIQKTELNPGGVGEPAHHAVQGVDLPDEMALAQSADRRVAGHRARIVGPQGDQRDHDTHPCRRRGRFDPRMARTNDDDIIVFHVKHLFPDAESRKDLVKIVVRRDAANDFVQP